MVINSITEPGFEREKKYEVLETPAERMDVEIGIVKLFQKISEGSYDLVVFLDKSARPFTWFFEGDDCLWNKVFPNKTKPNMTIFNPSSMVINDSDLDNFKNDFEEDFAGVESVLVVDEKTLAGGTRSQAVKLMSSFGVEYQYDFYDVMFEIPSWHNSRGEKNKFDDYICGVRDLPVGHQQYSYGVEEYKPRGYYELRKDFENLGKDIEKKFIETFPIIEEIKDLKPREMDGYLSGKNLSQYVDKIPHTSLYEIKRNLGEISNKEDLLRIIILGKFDLIAVPGSLTNGLRTNNLYNRLVKSYEGIESDNK